MSAYPMNRYFRSEEEFEATTRQLVSYLRRLARGRVAGQVSADDVHTFLDRQGVQPEQVRTRLRFINTVFNSNSEYFSSAGQTRSTRPNARGRMISSWIRS